MADPEGLLPTACGSAESVQAGHALLAVWHWSMAWPRLWISPRGAAYGAPPGRTISIGEAAPMLASCSSLVFFQSRMLSGGPRRKSQSSDTCEHRQLLE